MNIIEKIQVLKVLTGAVQERQRQLNNANDELKEFIRDNNTEDIKMIDIIGQFLYRDEYTGLWEYHKLDCIKTIKGFFDLGLKEAKEQMEDVADPLVKTLNSLDNTLSKFYKEAL